MTLWPAPNTMKRTMMRRVNALRCWFVSILHVLASSSAVRSTMTFLIIGTIRGSAGLGMAGTAGAVLTGPGDGVARGGAVIGAGARRGLGLRTIGITRARFTEEALMEGMWPTDAAIP